MVCVPAYLPTCPQHCVCSYKLVGERTHEPVLQCRRCVATPGTLPYVLAPCVCACVCALFATRVGVCMHAWRCVCVCVCAGQEALGRLVTSGGREAGVTSLTSTSHAARGQFGVRSDIDTRGARAPRAASPARRPLYPSLGHNCQLISVTREHCPELSLVSSS